jgi:dihydroflavonol-4-reductase
MRDAAVVTRAMKGIRFLFHVAANYLLCARKPEEILVNNREGTRLPMEAALAAGAERIVYTSSVATIACAQDGGWPTERIRLSESGAIGAYKQSKVAAERVVETMIGQNHLLAIIVHPTAPIGPRDQAAGKPSAQTCKPQNRRPIAAIGPCSTALRPLCRKPLPCE